MAAPRPLLKGFEKVVANIRPDPTRRITIADPDSRGLYLRVMPSGHKTFTVVSRDPNGRQVWAALGNCDTLSLEEARSLAREAVKRIKNGLPAIVKQEAGPNPVTFQQVHDNFLVRHVEKQALRTGSETKRIFRVYVLPSWATRPIADIKRGEIARLLDGVEDNNGPVMADRVLAALSKLFNWHASREDDFSSPIVRGMGRTSARERARNRKLTDQEIRLIWKAAERAGAFGASLQMALVTGQRRSKVGAMRWEEVKDGVWTIASEPREKGNPGKLRLPGLALEILNRRPRLVDNPFVFAGRGGKAIAGLSQFKLRFDTQVMKLNGNQAIPPWVTHDLRRTAKSLMARADVHPHISERVLGHVIGGVEGIYDRHDYMEEKAEALERLGALLEEVLAGQQFDSGSQSWAA